MYMVRIIDQISTTASSIMDDWQSAAFNNRHLHNRVDRRQSKKSKGGGGSAVFNPRNSLGSYSVKCSAATNESTNAQDRYNLEIFQFSEDNDGLIGTLTFPGILQATIALAGSRKELDKVADGLGYGSGGSSKEITNRRWSSAIAKQQISTEFSATKDLKEDQENEEHDDEEHEEEDQESPGEESQSEAENDNRFEKNSFRNPKFWMQWQGEYLGDPNKEDDVLNGFGYVIFTGNDCKKFGGTLTCDTLGWNNVKMSGWKTAWKAERDLSISWK